MDDKVKASDIELVRMEHGTNQCTVHGCTLLAQICTAAERAERLAGVLREIAHDPAPEKPYSMIAEEALKEWEKV